MAASKRVPIRPHVGVFSVFEAVDYKAWFALAEFVDNSIQSWVDAQGSSRLPAALKRDPLRINIAVDSGPNPAIQISDNAAGIDIEDFPRAFEVGSPPPDPSGLSVYGIGMKSAAAWFADICEVRTTCLGSTTAHTVKFDFPKIISQAMEYVPISEAAVEATQHGTVVTLTNMKHPIQAKTHAKVRDHLASIYRKYIRDGSVVITYRGNQLRYEDPEILEAPSFKNPRGALIHWRKKISLELSSGERIEGFAALRKVGRAAGSGFSLYRNNRVITGLEDDPWRPVEIFGYGNSYRSQRLFGELQLVNVKVAYSKNAFIWQASEEELIEKLREALDEYPMQLMQQAEGYRSRKPEARERDAAKKAADRAGKGIADSMQHETQTETAVDEPETDEPETDELNIVDPEDETSSEAENDQVAVFHEYSTDVTFKGTPWRLSVQVTDDESADWLSILEGGSIVQDRDAPRAVQIQVNINTPFMRRFAGRDSQDLEAIFRVCGAIAIAILVARGQGLQMPDYLLQHINRLMNGTLGGTND